MNLKKTLMTGLRHRLYGRREEERSLELVQVGLNDDALLGREYVYHILDGESGEQLGRMELRLSHSQAVEFLGNVGYSILPQHRGHRYAAQACLLLADVARELGMDYLTFTCDTDNTASRRTIESLGAEYLGLLERRVHINASHAYIHKKYNFRWDLRQLPVAGEDAKGDTSHEI